MKNIQNEIQKIHSQYGISELANYKIQLLFESYIKTALAEQHRNTRHDAVEIMQQIRVRCEEKHNFSICEPMLNEITEAIMNLKQRTPKT